MRILILLLALVAPASLGQGGLAGLAQSGNQFLPVSEAYRLSVDVDGPLGLRLNWRIEDGYYLYKHQFKIALDDADGPVGTDIDYAPAEPKTDEFFGDVEVYYQFAALDVDLERPVSGAELAVTFQGCADAGLCYPPETLVFTLDTTAGTVTAGAPEPGAAESARPADAVVPAEVPLSLAAALLFAFLGGLILNAMPCVFPILSLKVLSFATGDPATHHRHGWFYLAGVVLSFVAIAAVLISLQGAGQLIGWGFQLQSPGFIIALAYLFTAMGLSLSGLVQFGGGLMNLGSTLAGQGGGKGSFFTGVLAVVVASPCTAPFMGSALGFALTQPAVVALGVFAALGVGMAAPMVLLSYSGWARRHLPKPGAWMETLKELLAFPLYATVVWLLWVAGKQVGVDAMAAALLGIVLLALGLFLWRPGFTRKAVAVVCIAAAVGLASVRGPAPNATEALRTEGTVNWSPEALAGLRAEGRAVFVDVTADWCITCLANEQAVLFTDAMRAAFEEAGVVYMVADWTNYDPAIGAFVKSHGRNGIPLYVMYPAGGGAPFILPQLLSAATMRDALAAASDG